MAVTLDILETYRAPRRVVARQLQGGVREDRTLLYAMLACGLIFVGQWPRLAREAALDPSVPLDARLGGALMGWLVIAPLMLYVLAGMVHLVLRLFGGQGTSFATRLSVFWGLLAAAPLWMLHGLMQGFVGPGPTATLVGFAVLVVTLVFQIQGLRAAARPVTGIVPGEKPA